MKGITDLYWWYFGNLLIGTPWSKYRALCLWVMFLSQVREAFFRNYWSACPSMHWNSKCSWLAWMEVKLMGLRLGNAKSLRCMEVRKCWTAHSHQIIRSSDIIRPRMWHALWVSFSQRPSSSLSFCALRMLHSKVLHLSYQNKKHWRLFLIYFFVPGYMVSFQGLSWKHQAWERVATSDIPSCNSTIYRDERILLTCP